MPEEKQMLKFLTVPLLALTMALAPVGAAPARANSTSNSDVAKVLAGVALLAFLAAAANSAKAKPAPVPARPVHPVPPGLAKRDLPAQCRERIHERGHDSIVYGKRCLQQHYRLVHHLPRACEDTVTVFGRSFEVYRAQCLRRYGWTA